MWDVGLGRVLLLELLSEYSTGCSFGFGLVVLWNWDFGYGHIQDTGVRLYVPSSLASSLWVHYPLE
jgi:hypothetical protein